MPESLSVSLSKSSVSSAVKSEKSSLTLLSSVSIVSVESSKESSISRGGSSGVSSAAASGADVSVISTPKSPPSIKSSREISSVPPSEAAGAGEETAAAVFSASGPFPGSYPLLPLATESSEKPSSRKSSREISSSPELSWAFGASPAGFSAAGSLIESKLISSKSAFVSVVSVLISRLSSEADESASISENPSKAAVLSVSAAGASKLLSSTSGTSISDSVSICGISKLSSSGMLSPAFSS